MEQQELLALVSLLLGILARVFIPFFQARQSDPDLGWNWQFVWPQLLAVGILLLALPAIVADINAVLTLPWQAAWLVGYGAASAGNLAGRVQRHRAQVKASV